MDSKPVAISIPPDQGGCWPTEEQELLLQAALMEGSKAIDAWTEWNSRVDVDLLERGSQRLLPLLYRNLRAHGVENPALDKFKGFYRLAWYKNQMLLRNISSLLQCLNDSGIQTMVLKGAALVLQYYNDYGLRPMDDVDVLVRQEHVIPALDLLKKQGLEPITELGWKPDLESLKANPDKLLPVKHAIAFMDASGRQFDLHWHVLFECRYERADEDYWVAAEKINLHDITTHVLSPTDQLFHICIHGALWHSLVPVRWVADAMMILKTAESDIDWSRLTSHAQGRRLILPLRNALAYLRTILDAPVPSEVLHRLQEMSVSRTEQMEYRLKSRPPGLTGGLPLNWFLFLRAAHGDSGAALRPKFIGFPTFLQNTWGLDHLWQVPLYGLSKALKKIYKS